MTRELVKPPFVRLLNMLTYRSILRLLWDRSFSMFTDDLVGSNMHQYHRLMTPGILLSVYLFQAPFCYSVYILLMILMISVFFCYRVLLQSKVEGASFYPVLSLLIYNLTAEDAGIYTCDVTSSDNNTVLMAQNINVQVASSGE